MHQNVIKIKMANTAHRFHHNDKAHNKDNQIGVRNANFMVWRSYNK